MNKGRTTRVVGFVAALGATASLVGFAAHGTGAYFSDAKSGSMSVSTGNVEVHTGGITGLDFTNLLPGTDKSQQIQYAVNGTGPEDVYLAFDQPGDNYLNGKPAPGAAPLGRYGHLLVQGPSGSFESYNLATDPTAAAPGQTVADGQDCSTNSVNGLGGSNQQATQSPAATNDSNGYGDPSGQGSGSISLIPYCPAPQYILLSSNLTAGNGTQTATINFGFTKFLESGQSSPTTTIPFRIVAEQAGVSPYDNSTTNKSAS